MKDVKILGLCMLLFLPACGNVENTTTASAAYSISLAFTRSPQAGLDPFTVTASLSQDGSPLSNQSITVTVPKGTVSATVDQGDGTYTFTVTPASTGVYPVTVSYGGTSVTRKALVFDNPGSSVEQPLSVPGDYVNTEGYEDGITITPDGEYLFVQYGPVYFSGLIYIASSICTSGSYSIGYDLNNCAGNANSDWVFKTIGPYAAPQRPDFPAGRISSGTITHLSALIVSGVANGLAVPPTVFYGFKRQSDGTFAQPFKVAFDDQSRGIQSPYGLSFQMTGTNQATVLFAWNDYTNQLGDDKADIYHGSFTLGQAISLGSATYDSNDFVTSITPSVSPVGFTAHTGTQGNPHIYYDGSNVVQSIWVDDEVTSHNLTVYRLTSGSFPSGTWSAVNLPAKINTGEEESQPFFTGSRLYLRRGNRIVYHDYVGSGGTDYDQDAAWGSEVVVLGSNLNTGVDEIISVGEPTLATVSGKTYLYFVYGTVRSKGVGDLSDINMDAGFVELK